MENHVINFFLFFGPVFAIIISLGQLVRIRKEREDYIFGFSFMGMGFWMIQICLYSSGIFDGSSGIYYLVSSMIPFATLVPAVMVVRYKYVISRTYQIKPYHVIYLLPSIAGLALVAAPIVIADIPEPGQFFPGLPVFGERFAALPLYYQAVNVFLFIPNICLILYMTPVLVSMLPVWYPSRSPHYPYVARMGYLFAAVIVLSNIICVAGNFFSFTVIKIAVLMANVATVMVYLTTQRNPDYLRLLQSETRKAHYDKTRLKGVDIDAVIARLYEIMEDEKAFADEEISISTLAGELGVSLHQLSEILNEKIKKNFKTFVNEFRVNEARKLLVEEPDRSVLSVGVAVGFNSNTTFCTVFSRMTGMSPGQYRRSHAG